MFGRVVGIRYRGGVDGAHCQEMVENVQIDRLKSKNYCSLIRKSRKNLAVLTDKTRPFHFPKRVKGKVFIVYKENALLGIVSRIYEKHKFVFD